MKNKNVRIFQNIIKIAILLFLTYLAIMHQLKGVVAAPSIHTFCPFGGLESFFKLIVEGSYIKKIFSATIVLLIGTVILAIILGRPFCGWICPLGTLGDLFNKLGRKLNLKQNPLPEALDKYMKYIKYVGLVILLGITWKTGELVFNLYDPWATYAHIPAGFEALFDEFKIGSLFLIAGTIGSLWIPQNWCKYFCPMGAFLAIVSKISPTRLHRNGELCINCGLCSKICPISIKVSEMETVSTRECYDCGDCVNVCPKDGALEYRMLGFKKINWLAYGLITIFLFYGTIYTSKALKIWNSGFGSAGEVLKGEHGYPNPYNIKGSLTLHHVITEFEIPPDLLMKKLSIPEDVSKDLFLKSIASKYSFSVHDIRLVILEYLQEKYPDRTYKQPLTGESSKGGHASKQGGKKHGSPPN